MKIKCNLCDLSKSCIFTYFQNLYFALWFASKHKPIIHSNQKPYQALEPTHLLSSPEDLPVNHSLTSFLQRLVEARIAGASPLTMVLSLSALKKKDTHTQERARENMKSVLYGVSLDSSSHGSQVIP